MAWSTNPVPCCLQGRAICKQPFQLHRTTHPERSSWHSFLLPELLCDLRLASRIFQLRLSNAYRASVSYNIPSALVDRGVGIRFPVLRINWTPIFQLCFGGNDCSNSLWTHGSGKEKK